MRGADHLDRVSERAGKFLWEGELLGLYFNKRKCLPPWKVETKGKPKRVREKDNVRRGKKNKPMSSVEGLSIRRKLMLKFRRLSPIASQSSGESLTLLEKCFS